MFSRQTACRDFLLIVYASISWGTIGIAKQFLFTTGTTNALSLSFFRLVIATPLFFLAAWLRLGRGLFRIKRRDLTVMMLMGSLIALSQACRGLRPLLEESDSSSAFSIATLSDSV